MNLDHDKEFVCDYIDKNSLHCYLGYIDHIN